jgi:hypothetical protein
MATTVAQAGTLSLDLVSSIRYDDNLNRAQRGSERQDDGIFAVSADGSYRRQLTANSGLIAKLGLETEVHADIGDLDMIRAKTSLTYLMQAASGFGAPWFALTAAFQLDEYSASDIRDGTVATLGAEAGKRFTDRIAARLGYEVRNRNPSSKRVFKQRQGIFHVLGDYSVTDRIGAYLKYEYLDGGVVTTAAPNMRFRGVVRSFWRDRAFGPGMVAWRLDGHTHAFRLGGKYVLAKHTALDLAATHARTDADGDNKWNVWNVGLTLSHRFQ